MICPENALSCKISENTEEFRLFLASFIGHPLGGSDMLYPKRGCWCGPLRTLLKDDNHFPPFFRLSAIASVNKEYVSVTILPKIEVSIWSWNKLCFLYYICSHQCNNCHFKVSIRKMTLECQNWLKYPVVCWSQRKLWKSSAVIVSVDKSSFWKLASM